MKISTGLWYIDHLLKEGIKTGYTYEIAGYPWDIIKDHIHYIIPNLARYDKITVLYGQYFDGINPYKITLYSRIFNIEYKKIKDKIRVIRGFKGEDYIDGVKRLENIDGILVLIDPYLHAYMTNNKKLFGGIASRIYMLKRIGKTIFIFNRLLSDGKPLGGEFHRHIADYIITMKYHRNKLLVELVKALDTPYRKYLLDYVKGVPQTRKIIQHTILEWTGG